MNNKILAVTLLIVSLILFGCSTDEKNEKVRKTEFHMGTVVEVILYGDENELNKDNTDKVFKEVFNEIKSIENNFTAGMIRGGELVYLDEEEVYLLEKSMYFSEITQGAFDITVGPLTKLWNISPGEENKIPQKEEMERCISLVDYNKIKTISPGIIHIENEEMFADFGAIAKGYAADRAVIILKNNEIYTAILNLGGCICHWRKCLEVWHSRSFYEKGRFSGDSKFKKSVTGYIGNT